MTTLTDKQHAAIEETTVAVLLAHCEFEFDRMHPREVARLFANAKTYQEASTGAESAGGLTR